MKLLKSEFSRIHALAALAAAVNLVLGVGMALYLIPYVPFGEVHGFAGAVTLPLLLLLPLLSPKRKSLYTALRNKFLIRPRDLAQKNWVLISAKIVTWLIGLAFLCQLATGALMETGLAYQLFPTFSILSFHTTFLYILPPLVVLHVVLMLLAKRKPVKAAKVAE